MQAQWIEFDGMAIDNGGVWLLQSYDGTGAIAAAKSNVRILGESVALRRGAAVTIVKGPADGSKPASIAVSERDCPSGKTRCIGLVMICCDDNVLLGTGLGRWNDCH